MFLYCRTEEFTGEALWGWQKVSLLNWSSLCRSGSYFCRMINAAFIWIWLGNLSASPLSSGHRLEETEVARLVNKPSAVPPLQTQFRFIKKCELFPQDLGPQGAVACIDANLHACLLTYTAFLLIQLKEGTVLGQSVLYLNFCHCALSRILMYQYINVCNAH